MLVHRDHDGDGLERSVVGREVVPTKERVHCQVPVKRDLKFFC